MESVVLVDEAGYASGTADKTAVLAIDGPCVYFQAPADNGFYLRRLGVPADCRAR